MSDSDDNAMLSRCSVLADIDRIGFFRSGFDRGGGLTRVSGLHLSTVDHWTTGPRWRTAFEQGPGRSSDSKIGAKATLLPCPSVLPFTPKLCYTRCLWFTHHYLHHIVWLNIDYTLVTNVSICIANSHRLCKNLCVRLWSCVRVRVSRNCAFQLTVFNCPLGCD